MLYTERLILRKWTETDADSLYEYAKDPAVGPAAGWPAHESREDSLDVIRNVLNGAECYAICDDKRTVGQSMPRQQLESTFGAKLDSVVDFAFAGCLTIFAVKNRNIPIWLWLCALVIALLRLASYGIGFYKYHDFTALHIGANKLTGILIFISPILYCLCGLQFTGIILCAAAFGSACEELVITIKSKLT